MAGTRAFREAYLSAGGTGEAWSDFDARQTRYAILWAYYESTAYRTFLQPWATKYVQDYALYKYVRNIYNPSARLAEVWVQFLVGGLLDEGADNKGALPIVLPAGVLKETAAALRSAIAQVWRDSVWQVNKSIWARYGVVKGDTAIKVIDDTKRAKVYFEVIRPESVKALTRDPFGNVKRYELEEERDDPRASKTGKVKYTEIGERVAGEGESSGGEGVVQFKTLLNDAPYAWNGIAAEWEENYGFVPFVAVKHIDVGFDWGWAEAQTSLSKFREIDNQASALNDQVTKAVKAPFMINAKKPTVDVKIQGAQPTAERPEPGKEEMPILYVPDPNARAQSLVTDLNIEAVSQHIGMMLEHLERDYPELQADVFKLGNDASGRALRTLREPVEARVMERRAAYDDALVRAHKMALSIGAQRGYGGFGAFNAESFNAGELNHSIGARSVFRQDPMDDLDYKKLFWETAAMAVKGGQPLEEFLREAGWDEERISRIVNSKEFQAKRNAVVEAFGGERMKEEG